MNIRLFLFTFSVIFAKIWHNIANIIQNKLKFLTAECCFTVRDKIPLLNSSIEVLLWLKFLIKFSKLKLFSSKMAQNKILWSTLIKLAPLSDLETLTQNP